ncbi:MAG: sigma-70 family RNA polymerase sigma factor [Myxococcales bacterium]|nr:sigma-70 family RNA polymerase sigma factor [Myxococcales bacterium]
MVSFGSTGALAHAPAYLMSTKPSCADIFRQHGPMVWRLLRRLGVPDADLDDLTQDVFIAVHRGLGTYEERNQLRAWIYKICVREVSRYRRAAPPRSAPLDGVDAPSEAASPEAAMERSQARADFDRLLGALDEPRRAVFVLYEIEELTMADVAAAVGCPVQTAYSRLHSARELIVEAGRRLEAARAHAAREPQRGSR